MNFGLTLQSNNGKTGRCPVASASSATCPTACPFRDGGCYAALHYLGAYWRKIDSGERGMSWGEFLSAVEDLPRDRPWRYGDAGDLPGVGNRLSRPKVAALVKANDGRRGFTYTHYPVLRDKWAAHNWAILAAANGAGLTINVSAEGLAKADALHALGLPVATVLPRSLGDWRRVLTPRGVPVVRCPAEYSWTQCINCGGTKGPICARANRHQIVGLTAHGAQAKQVERIIAQTEEMSW